MDADAQLDQVEHLGVQRDARFEVVQLEMDLVDLDDGMSTTTSGSSVSLISPGSMRV